MAGTRQQALSKKARAHGARNFSLRTIIEAQQTTHVPASLGLALIDKESGFRNVYGHDAVRNPVRSPAGGFLTVTKTNYANYKRHRDAGEGQQGVGPAQLTAKGFQDQADKLGGCHIPRHNIHVAVRTLNDLIAKHGLRRGLASYNAGEGGWRNGLGYADSVIALQRKWHEVLT